MDGLAKLATEIRLHSNNVNRDGGLTPSQSWNSVLYMLQQPDANIRRNIQQGDGQMLTGEVT
jgi:hypothetical protein